jgi:hypothetical protein
MYFYQIYQCHVEVIATYVCTVCVTLILIQENMLYEKYEQK